VVEDSYDCHEFEGELVEWHTRAGCFEFVEVIDYKDPDPKDSPPSWWCRECPMPKELVPLATKKRPRPRYNTLPE
jgi:hypothetical protein